MKLISERKWVEKNQERVETTGKQVEKAGTSKN